PFSPDRNHAFLGFVGGAQVLSGWRGNDVVEIALIPGDALSGTRRRSATSKLITNDRRVLCRSDKAAQGHVPPHWRRGYPAVCGAYQFRDSSPASVLINAPRRLATAAILTRIAFCGS